MFVDPLGRDAERTPLNVETVRVHDLPLTRGRTVYDRVGDVTAWAALAAFAIAGFTAWRRG
jgi:apolipoprotein N-acyltransferase